MGFPNWKSWVQSELRQEGYRVFNPDDHIDGTVILPGQNYWYLNKRHYKRDKYWIDKQLETSFYDYVNATTAILDFNLKELSHCNLLLAGLAQPSTQTMLELVTARRYNIPIVAFTEQPLNTIDDCELVYASNIYHKSKSNPSPIDAAISKLNDMRSRMETKND
jgi:hypothetical protein